MTSAIARSNHSVSGSQLAPVIRAAYPMFRYDQYESAGLREFINKHAPDIVEVGRQGLDVLFDLRERASSADVASAAGTISPSGAELWRAVSSPNSERAVQVQVKLRSGEWRIVPPTTPESDDWRAVRPPAIDEHLRIAERFVETVVNADLQSRLAEAMQADRWWLKFRNVLDSSADEQLRYVIFRAESICGAIRERLEALGMESEPIQYGLSRITFPTNRPQVRAVHSSSGNKALGPSGRPLTSLRSLASELVGSMPEEELRQLRVRLGDVFDIVRRP